MKTDRTLEIEQLLTRYYPDSVAGLKINKFRKRYLAFECPVTCGTVKGGLVDLVCVDETLVKGHKESTCNIGSHLDWYTKYAPEVVAVLYDAATDTKGCVRGYKNLSDFPAKCDKTACNQNCVLYNYVNDICISCYEIKVSKSDFHSSNGHNFVGNANYYVMPKELYLQVKDEIPEHVGVIIHEVTDKVNRLRKAKEAKFVPKSDGEVKWMLLNVLKKQNNYYVPTEEYSEDYELWR